VRFHAIKQILEPWVGAQCCPELDPLSGPTSLKLRPAERQGAAAAGKQVVTSYDKEDIKVLVHGDMAVMSYRFVIRIQTGGNDINRRYRTTNAWVKRQAGGQVVAAHTANLES
jgi:hypothetical protein